MKKFERLPLNQRKDEIKQAALVLFNQKGFSKTTMENIIEKVTLSKGGVYRIYPGTAEILSDLMIDGMKLRNTYYENIMQNHPDDINLSFLVSMIMDSLLIYPEFSKIYVEFLWEKQRNSKLEQVYQQICVASINETVNLIKKYHMEKYFLNNEKTLLKITECMNATILSLHTLKLNDFFCSHKKIICDAICQIIQS